MLTWLRVSNFKAIRDRAIRLGRGVNLIVGPTASGKSSLLEALALLMQSRGEDVLLIEGRLIMFHELIDIVRDLNPYNRVSIGVGVGIDDRVGGLLRDVGLNADGGEVLYSYSFTPATGDVEQEVSYGEFKLTYGRYSGINKVVEPIEVSLCVTPYHVINEDSLETCSELPRELSIARALLFALREGLKDSFYYIGENRIAWWKRSFETTVDLLPEHSVGGDGQYTVHQLSRILTIPSMRRDFVELMEFMRSLGVDDLTAGFTEPNRIMGFIKAKSGWGTLYSAGLGLKSILPVIVQLVLTPPGSTLAVDGIDIGLDPGTLTRVLEAIAGYASRKGIQLILTSRIEAGAYDNLIKLNADQR